ncbi:MAG: hypothetical protein Q7J98_12900 [Kiritimatiellia bacterium]|nr:hypothetical protein [Kiritimatiellia bacterium]
MADVYFKCVCGKSLAIDAEGIGLTVLCVDCGEPVKVPEYDIEFDCEQCQTTHLAPVTVGGDQIKCSLCGHSMIVPRPGIDCKPVGAAEVRRNAPIEYGRYEFQVRRRSASEPTPAGIAWHGPFRLMFRLALLVLALTVGAELAKRFIAERRTEAHRPKHQPVLVKEKGRETLAQGAKDKPSSQPAVKDLWATQSAELADETEGGTLVFTAATRFVGMPKLAVKKSSLNSNIVKVAAASTISARNQQTVSVASAKTSANKSPVKSVIHPAKALPGEKQGPSLQEMAGEAQKLNALINYKKGPGQSKEFFDLLGKCMAQINKYTQTHTGKDLDDFYWGTSYWLIYGYAIKTARNYEEAEKILRRGWALLEGPESDEPRAVPRAMLSMGVNLAQDWVKENPLECADLLAELEEMAREMGDDKIGDIWRLNAPNLQIRFMKYAGNVPDEQREAFIRRHKKCLEGYLMDDSILLRNRSFILRSWITLLDRTGSLEDAMPINDEWRGRYGEKTMEMTYYLARLLVELYGEGDWEKAAKTVRLATLAAQKGGKLFDKKNYVRLIKLYYDLQNYPGYELKRQRAVKLNKAGKDEMKLTFYKRKTK